jgi:hypothetical protein
LQTETVNLVQEQQAFVSERQAAHQAGLRAREMEAHAQRQLAELNQREVCMQQDWQALQHECTTLTRDESLMQNLIACQDMIHEEVQVCQQQQRQLLEQAQTPQLVEGLRALPGQNEIWGGAMAGNAPMDRDSGRLFRPETGVTEVRDDGRSLRQSLD